MQHLNTSTVLQGGRYRILSTLGQGGFGITYLAEQCLLGRKVAIKEFFVKELCDRNDETNEVTSGSRGGSETVKKYHEKFLKEATNIARLSHPNIVRVIEVFEENGTAYYVMEHIANGSLADKVKKEGYLAEPVATRYIRQVASALEYIHKQNISHLDVKPGNIMLTDNDEAVLIDFGLSKHYDSESGNQTSSTPVGISEGYAPLEQYKTNGIVEFSPETDIYALGATYYKLLTGITPPNASDVNEDGLPLEPLRSKGVSQPVIDAISMAMKSRRKDRFKRIKEFADLIKTASSNHGSTQAEYPGAQSSPDGDITRLVTSTPTPPPDINKYLIDENEDPGRKLKIIIVALVGLIAIFSAVIIFSLFHINNNENGTFDSSAIVVGDTSIVESEGIEEREEPEHHSNMVVAATPMENEETEEQFEPTQTVIEPVQPASRNDDTHVYDVVEHMPSFPGGTGALMSWLSSNIHYPAVAEENGIQGRVICSFVVERDGSLTDVRVAKGVDPSLDQEAVRVVKSMPKWSPGKINGEPVRVKYTLPVTFRLR